MSVKTASTLPRFGEYKGFSPLTVFQDSETPAMATVDLPTEKNVPAQEEAPVFVPEAPPLNDDVELREQIEKTLQTISTMSNKLEEVALERLSFAIQSIAKELFPRLMDELVSNEFALHLPDLFKLAPIEARIEANPSIAAQLRLASQNIENWPTDWVIEEHNEFNETRIEVIWQRGQGGLTYDPAKLLETCIKRLSRHELNKGMYKDGPSQ